MASIQILSPLLADMIAAGEVVERPASVIKELMENALDAGAKNITVELRGGGSTFIRVTDDGCGMAPEDAGVAFLRHATSKLRSERGLEAIGTLGFRGEALAAISAVSRVELSTRVKGAEDGSFVSLEAGDIQEMRPAGCPEGTTMIVRDLFFNTPARFKFLKSDRTEAQSCVATALRCALGHPEVSVRCIRDGQSLFFSPGDGRADSCVYSLLGRDVAQGFLKCRGAGERVEVSGFVSSPRAGRGSRAGQYFYCNGRPIRSATLQAALEQAYKNSIMVGRFPACVLYITLSHALVDVNVHPTKSEVKFSDERGIFDAVYHAVLSALEQENPLPGQLREASVPRLASPGPEGRASGPTSPTAGGQRPMSAHRETPNPGSAPRGDFYKQMTAEDFRSQLQSGVLGKDRPQSRGSVTVASPSLPYLSDPQPGFRIRHVETPPMPAPERAQPVPEEALIPEEEPLRLVGEVFDCYILVQKGDTLYYIDKHAAHERILFDRLKAQERAIMAQSLLEPVTFTCGGGDTELLLGSAPLLEKLGFEVEAFGEDSVVLRAIPAETEETQALPMLEEILEKLRRGDAPAGEDALDELLHTIACKAAIKAGRSSDRRELLTLAERVLSGEVRYCPHGRPVSHAVTKKALDRDFGRLG